MNTSSTTLTAYAHSTSFLGELVTKLHHLVATSLHIQLRDTFVFVTSRATIWMMTKLLALVSMPNYRYNNRNTRKTLCFLFSFSTFLEIMLALSTELWNLVCSSSK